MKIEDAIEMIREKYQENRTKKYIVDPVAYTLHEVWRIADCERESGRERKRGAL